MPGDLPVLGTKDESEDVILSYLSAGSSLEPRARGSRPNNPGPAILLFECCFLIRFLLFACVAICGKVEFDSGFASVDFVVRDCRTGVMVELASSKYKEISI